MSIARLVSSLVCIGMIGCGGGDDGGGGGGDAAVDEGPLALSLPVDLDVPTTLPAGTYGVAFPIELPADFDLGTFESLAIDAEATFAAATITRVTSGPDPATISLGVTVAAGDAAADSCGGGVLAGRLLLSDEASPGTFTVEPAQVAAPAEALALLSSGAFTVCIDASVSTDVTLDLAGGLFASFELDADCDEPPAALAGTWTGTYACEDECAGTPSDEAGDIVIEVRQVGETAVYWDDGGAVYLGSVCGAELRHLGGKLTYWEYGRFARDGDAATKISTWASPFGGTCGGTCTDALTRTAP